MESIGLFSKKNTISCLLLGLLVIFGIAKSQQKDIFFDKINGLSSPMITALMQDHQGFLWIGTWGGLDRYDGYTIKVYKSVQEDSTSLCTNGIREIIEDRNNRIWVACNIGLSLYDSKKDKFVRFLNNNNDTCSLVGNDICCMFLDKRGKLWIGTYFNGLCNLDVANSVDFVKTKPLFKQYKHSETNNNSITSNYIRSIFEDNESNIWINAGNHIIDRYNQQNNCFDHYDIGNLPFDEGTDFISIQLEDNDGLLWFSTRGNGMFSWNRKTSAIKQYHFIPNQNSLNFNIIRQIRKDNSGIFWICTDGGGISFFNEKTGIFEQCTYDETNPHSVGSNVVYRSFEDRSGVTWFATYDAGLNKYNAYKTAFKAIRPDLLRKNSINNKSVLCILEDSDGKLWIGTDGGGLNVYDKNTKKYSYFMHSVNDKNSISSNAITCLIEDYMGNIWIGTYGGVLNCYDKKNNKFIRYQNDPGNENSISHNDVWSMFEDSKHNIWVITLAGTLNLLDRRTGKFYRYKQNPNDPNSFGEGYSCQIFEDSRHYIWIASSAGVEMFKLDDYDFTIPGPNIRFAHFVHKVDQNSISTNNAFTICEDNRGNMWVGTEDGRLNKLDMLTSHFTAFTDDDLKDNGIRATILDNNNDIWVSTIKGLWKFSPKNETFRKFDLSDGLQDMSFSRASYKTKDGKLYFGGINGFNTFYPNDIPYNKNIPQVVITDFKINNKSVHVGEVFYNSVILDQPINNIKELIFSNKVNFFSLEFSALDFTNPDKNKYEYKLEGFDRQWINTDAKNRIVTYTNLNPGEYCFKVKACNNDGIWNNEGTSLKIIILPPWWKTLWFKAVLFLTIMVLIFIAYYLRVSLYRKRQKELTIMVRQRTQELLTTNKLLTERQARIEEQSEELRSTNEKLLERQTKIEEQANEIRANSANLKEINELLIEKQKLVLEQSDQLKETNQKLSLLNATKDRLFSIIAHDLRNPFNVVTGFSEILLRNINKMPPEKVHKYLNMIYASSISGNYLLENLLQWSRSQAGYISFEPAKLKLLTIAEETMRLLEGDAERKHISFNQLIDPDLFIFADENMIKTILRNLISNAIKFSFEDGIITINSAINEQFIDISVSDNGVGISNENINKLFRVDSMVTTKGTEKEPGTGLGLIICKEFAERHKGNIKVHSELGKGSTFTISLPL